MKEIILDLRVISNELILAGKLQLKKLQKKKPEKKVLQNLKSSGPYPTSSQVCFHTFPYTFCLELLQQRVRKFISIKVLLNILKQQKNCVSILA